MNIRVDTLEFSNLLEKAGMERAHAEAIAKLQARTVDLVEQELVTKDYFNDHLKAELTQLEARLDGKLSQFEGKLRDEIRGESTKLRDELRNEATQRRDELRDEASSLRDEIRNESTTIRRQMDAMMLQIRAIQLGGTIAAFVLGAVVLLARLIR